MLDLFVVLFLRWRQFAFGVGVAPIRWSGDGWLSSSNERLRVLRLAPRQHRIVRTLPERQAECDLWPLGEIAGRADELRHERFEARCRRGKCGAEEVGDALARLLGNDERLHATRAVSGSDGREP